MTEQDILRRDPHALLLDYGGPRIELSAVAPAILRVRYSAGGEFAPRRPWAVVRELAPPKQACDVEETDDATILRTGLVGVRIARQSGAVGFFDGSGRSFAVDAGGMGAGGMEATEHAQGQGMRCAKQIAADEHFYGFGERWGPLDKRGQRMINWTTDPGIWQGSGTDPLYIAMPLFVSVQPGLAYGVFLNSTWRSVFDMGLWRPDTWRMETAGGELDYYVIYGPTPERVLAGIGELLGRAPMPPRWALGYHQSRWGYRSADEVRAIAAELRRRALPCDAIHLDIDYMDGYRVFTWHPTRFPDPERLFRDLQAQQIRAVTIIDPGVKMDPEYSVYTEGLRYNAFISSKEGTLFSGFVWPDESVFPDFIKPETRAWWGSYIAKQRARGVSGIWNDMNEPTCFTRPFAMDDVTFLPISLDTPQGPSEARATHAEVRNVYALEMARATYDALCAASEERPFVLTRAAFAGIQRYSACWMGDNRSSWEHLEMSIPQLLNMSMSGVPFIGVDIGGFAGNCDGELLARWMQLGTFMPFCRNHSIIDCTPQEPWVFGPEIEGICREALVLRYRWLPYLYTLFWQAAREGTPIWRPLFFHYPNDAATYRLHDQFLVGPWVMCAPIYQPGRTYRVVYVPEGLWHDFWTGALIAGPRHIIKHAPLGVMPLYVKAGAIIPMGPDMQHTAEKPLDPLTLHLYPGAGELTLYEDDGLSRDYERGAFAATKYTLHPHGRNLTLTIHARQGSYALPERTLRAVFHAPSSRLVSQGTATRSQSTLVVERRDRGEAQAIELELLG